MSDETNAKIVEDLRDFYQRLAAYVDEPIDFEPEYKDIITMDTIIGVYVQVGSILNGSYSRKFDYGTLIPQRHDQLLAHDHGPRHTPQDE